MRQRSATRAHRFGGDGGAVMVEAAFLTPIFIALLFATLEFGGLFRDYLTINDTTASGARAAAIAGNDANADFAILQSIDRSAQALTRSGIRKIIVYKADNATTPVPANCQALTPSGPTGITGGTNPCNVYGEDELKLAENPAFINCASPTSYQRFWCPASRKFAAKADNGNGPPDFIGIFIEFEHEFFTGFFGESFTISSTTVTRLEPSSLL